MTRAEKDAVTRFQTYLLITKGDVEEALNLVERFSPRDRSRIGWLRELVRYERQHLHAAAS